MKDLKFNVGWKLIKQSYIFNLFDAMVAVMEPEILKELNHTVNQLPLKLSSMIEIRHYFKKAVKIL